jgi:hypothetical protein
LKTKTIILGAILLTFIGGCLYFVAGVSAVSPPIKSYEYNKSVNQLKAGLDNLTAGDRSITYRFTDTTGDKEVGYRYYADITLINQSDSLEYHIFYDKTDYWFKKNKTIIGLVLAFDATHLKGGYSYNADSEPLINIFEKRILSKLIK